MIPLVTKVAGAASAAFATAGVILAQVQGSTAQLQQNLPTVLIVFSAFAGLVILIYGVARALYALYGVAKGWTKGLAREEVAEVLAPLHKEIGTIKNMVAELRGEQRIIRIKLGADPYPTPPSEVP